MTAYSKYLADDRFCIFLFHGVINSRRHEVRNYTNKHILTDRFHEILDDLCRCGNPISMPDIVSAHRGEISLPPRGFAITFDDGFENNYSVAAPILEARKVPATFYITTNFIEENSTSWIDRIESAVESVNSFRLDMPQPTLRGWFAGRRRKIAMLDAVRAVVKNDSSVDPYQFADEVRSQIGVETKHIDADLDQMMNWRQINQLQSHPLFTIGGHSHTHRILDFLPQAELELEIQTSMDILSRRLVGPVTHYSYPEGLENCYSDRVIHLLQQHGILCSPTAEEGVNRSGDDLFRLKRVMVE